MIPSFRELQYGHLDNLNIKIRPFLTEFWAIKLPMEQYHGHFSVNYKINALFDQTRGFLRSKLNHYGPRLRLGP